MTIYGDNYDWKNHDEEIRRLEIRKERESKMIEHYKNEKINLYLDGLKPNDSIREKLSKLSNFMLKLNKDSCSNSKYSIDIYQQIVYKLSL